MKAKSDRRDFMKKAALLTGAVSVAGSSALAMSNSFNNVYIDNFGICIMSLDQ